ncbi:hypothetical protein ACFS5L_31935 [Streptomyces phyllanthi]|uniref:Uncharacterized protein n=1 Tax=Streptomyces phyllanthi TaxID=1803180 RepID=A0A5N8WDS6_9ACTN|nr:hypothetical protein [Streptomyces phyllanthi]MPY44986.1 hypothetical protein [Streptomyces phyllanthi]
MSPERETDHGMAHDDAVPQGIALLLADAADAVEIGTAPYQAVVRGGRRRKTRRWAVTAVAAVVIAGSTGTLALSGVMDGDGDRGSSAATRPYTAEERHVYKPRKTTVGTGREQGKDWKVTVDVWGAPRNEAEADRQYAAMKRTYKVAEVVLNRGSTVPAAPDQSDWIGKSRLYVRLTVGDQASSVVEEAFAEGGVPSGGDPKTYTTPLFDPIALTTGSGKLSDRQLVVGKVDPTAQQVRVTWSDGTTTEINRDEHDTGDQDPRTPRLLDAEGSSMSWFVVLAPKGLSHDSTKVMK